MSEAAEAKRKHRVLVPKFLTNTYEMVMDKSNEEYVRWNDEGTVVLIKKVHGFSEMVLPKYFRHSNYASFVRQLNMYGFTRAEMKIQAFSHPLFVRGKPQNLARIKRKSGERKAPSINVIESQKKELDQLFNEVKTLRAKQAEFDAHVFDIEAKNKHLDQENFQLWQAIKEGKKRQQNMVKKMKQMMAFIYYVCNAEGKRTPEIAAALPRLLQAAKESGVNIEAADLQRSPSALLGPLEPRDNDLTRMETQGTRSTLDGAELLRAVASPARPDEVVDDSASPTPAPLIATEATEGSDSAAAGARGTAGPSEPAADLRQQPSLALIPLSSKSADPMTRNASLQSFMDAMDMAKDPGSKRGDNFGEYHDLARGVSQYINEQDDALRRLESLSSIISDLPGANNNDGAGTGGGHIHDEDEDELVELDTTLPNEELSPADLQSADALEPPVPASLDDRDVDDRDVDDRVPDDRVPDDRVPDDRVLDDGDVEDGSQAAKKRKLTLV